MDNICKNMETGPPPAVGHGQPAPFKTTDCKQWFVGLSLFAVLLQAQACEGPRLQGSTVRLNALASNIDAEGIVGSSSTTRVLGLFGKKKSVQDMPAVLEVGVLSMGCNAALIGSELTINASANVIRLRGGTVRVGGVVMN